MSHTASAVSIGKPEVLIMGIFENLWSAMAHFEASDENLTRSNDL